MEITGETTFFVKKIGDETKARVIASAQIKRKYLDEGNESIITRQIDLEFDSKSFPESSISKLKENVCYTLEIKSGWLSLKRFKRKGEKAYSYDFIIHVKEGTLKKATPVDMEKKEKALAEYKNRKQAESKDFESPLKVSGEELPF